MYITLESGRVHCKIGYDLLMKVMTMIKNLNSVAVSVQKATT